MPHFEPLPNLDALCPDERHFGIKQASLHELLRDQLVAEGLIAQDVQPWQIRMEWNRHYGGYYLALMPKETILGGRLIDPTA